MLLLLLLESNQFLERFHTVVDSMNRHTRDKNYRLELRRRERWSMSKTTTPSVNNTTRAETESLSKKSVSEQETIKTHIQQLEKNNLELYKDLDHLKLQLLSHQELKGQLSHMQKEHSMLDKKYQKEQSAHKRIVQHLQEQLDNTSLLRRKTEERLLVHKETRAGDAMATQTTVLLEQIQEKYTKDVSSLTRELRLKGRSLWEMRKKETALVSALC